ncbi:MAG: amino acid racemase [Candidatus Aenigmarchaeota archaeon]|nr:amino acid racemase [Candidatus Aenigmarchaeota archaeon]
MTSQTIWKTIGILGGMGPESTAELYNRMIKLCQMDYGAKYDSDFPSIFILNLPLPDIVESVADTELVKASLKMGIEKLKQAGCDLIAVPCNTVFFALDIDSKILNIIDETIYEVKRRKLKKVGLLSSITTSEKGLYEKLEAAEIVQPSKNELKQVNKIILKILAGFKTEEDKAFLKMVCTKMSKAGAEAIILGCTELPLIISQKDTEIELLDTLEILAQAIVSKARFGNYD